MTNWHRESEPTRIVRFLTVSLTMRQARRIYCPLKPPRYVSHMPRLSNTFLLSLSFVARDRNTWEGYKFNFILRLNIISADIYGKYHAMVCCVTIEHRFIILSLRLILDICCSKNILEDNIFQTVLSTEISSTVNNSISIVEN